MARTLVLHVGLMKSGTTFLQGRLDANRDQLAAQGIHFAGPTWARHAKGIADFLELPQRQPGSWESLRDEIRTHEGTSVVSMEYLGPARPKRIQRLLSEFPDTRIEVVVTARDLGRSVPAMWQETLKNRRTWTWAEYVEGIRKGGAPGRAFWNQQDLATILGRWTQRVDADRVTVITVPPSGAPVELLWHRFSEVAGIAETDWQEAPRANESLGGASALLMRRLNLELVGLSRQQYKKRVKSLAKHTLVQRRGDEQPIGFAVPQWLRVRAEEANLTVTRLGVRVVGDLAELEPVDVKGVDPSTITPEQELEAAVFGLGAVLTRGNRALRRARSSP
jgi:hypothetical protein